MLSTIAVGVGCGEVPPAREDRRSGAAPGSGAANGTGGSTGNGVDGGAALRCPVRDPVTGVVGVREEHRGHPVYGAGRGMRDWQRDHGELDLHRRRGVSGRCAMSI
ncbi:MAG TPA: hypothetical protein VH374_14210 [Polyangia bacterium]|nr:hypothetical protein [Polyangia bacterium]